MSSYVVAGASRGLGFELLRQLSENPSNTVIGLVRNVESAKEKVASEINRPNVHILHADFERYETFPGAAAETSKITGGKLDYLIGNAAVGKDLFHLSLSELGKEPEKLDKDLTDNFRINAVAYAHLINAFMPLVLQGNAKKVIVMSTGLADAEFTRKYDLWMGVSYSISKAALNMIIAKFSAEYREKGVLVLGVSPGVVDTSDGSDAPEIAGRAVTAMASKFAEYAPQWKGAVSPEESVQNVLSVIEKASIDDNAGDVLSHLGNKRWL